jgi:O-antigen/teichoic acid export membrane protein
MKTSESVAYFQVAAQMTFLISIGLVVMNAVQAADYSSKFVASQFEDLQRLATYSARASLAIGLLMFAVYVLLGEPLLVLLFGPEYLQAYPALIILSVGHLVSAASGSVAILLYSSRNEQDVMMAIIIATLVNIALCILLIPGYGTAGAATASAASLASWNSILVWQVHKRLGIWSLPFAPRRRSQGSSGSGPAAR